MSIHTYSVFANCKEVGTFLSTLNGAKIMARRLQAELPHVSVALRKSQGPVNVAVTGNQRHRVLLANAKKLVAAPSTDPWNLLQELDQAADDADWFYEFSDCGDTYRRGMASVEHATRLYQEALAIGGEIAAEADIIWKAATAHRTQV